MQLLYGYHPAPDALNLSAIPLFAHPSLIYLRIIISLLMIFDAAWLSVNARSLPKQPVRTHL
jgi:hypothetical protein